MSDNCGFSAQIWRGTASKVRNIAAHLVARRPAVADIVDMPDAADNSAEPSEGSSSREAPPKVVFVAFACEPYRGSEPGVGWSVVHEMSRSQPVWAVVHASHRQPNDAYLQKYPSNFPIHFSYVSMPGLEWLLSGSYLAFNLYYYLWQFAAARVLRRLHREHHFDIVQHVSLMRWWMTTAATTLARRGVKFVWGPIGAGELMDRRFAGRIGWSNRLLESARSIARWICLRDPLFRRTVRSVDLALASTYESADRLREVGVERVELMSGIAVQMPPELLGARELRRPGKFRFISGGGLIYWKRYDLVLRAFAKAKLENAEYVHVCGGYEQERLVKLASELGLQDRVKFLGEMPYTQCIAELANSDALIHPVLRDSAGLIVEAITLGLPVLTLDHLSPRFLVPDDAGYRVPLQKDTTSESLVEDFARVMRQWHDDRELAHRLGAAAARHGASLARENRDRELHALHKRLLNQSRSHVPHEGSVDRQGAGRIVL